FPLTLLFSCFLFFFSSRRRHTRSLRDWSSDVCSSDLPYRIHRTHVQAGAHARDRAERKPDQGRQKLRRCVQEIGGRRRAGQPEEIGRASCRERVENSGGGVGVKKKK